MGRCEELDTRGELARLPTVIGATSSIRQSKLTNVPAPIETRVPYSQRKGDG